MRRYLLFFTVLALFGCDANKRNAEIPKDELEMAATVFDELKAALEKDHGQLWNHSLEGPIMLVNSDTRTIIANEKDNDGDLSKQGMLFVGKLPEHINIANTALNWNGKRWTMLALPLPENKEERLNLLIHESFYRIQPAMGFDSIAEISCAHLDSKNGRIYLKLELEALKSALNSEEPEMHIQHALLFRHYRYHLFPEAKHAENSLEIIEGLTEYTGSILSQRKYLNCRLIISPR